MEVVRTNHKKIERRKSSLLYGIRESVVKNWCLKRSRLLYAVASRCLSGEVKINIVMRCRNNVDSDWGHAWLTRNGKSLWEPKKKVLAKPKTMIADNGKYVYWIFDEKK